MIRAFLVTLVTFAYIAVLGPPLLIYAAIRGNGDLVYRIGTLGARMALWLAGTRLEIHGLDQIPSHWAVVFMANHQSNIDPPALLAILPPVLVLAKKEFFRVAILGRAMVACGFIPVDRRNREQALEAVEKGVQALKAGKSFLVYPEGTRSPDGRLQRFKKGVFVMAIKAGAPIVPISVSGSNKIMPKGKFVIRPGRVRITFHEPVATAGSVIEDRQLIIDRVRQAILTGLEEDEWPVEQ
ncbi:MAG: lysophospholipid acyltransferase family protein [Terriglobia bacterium]|jgi:1-acyl-sn-glycerol-3-phosphate acyltransferase